MHSRIPTTAIIEGLTKNLSAESSLSDEQIVNRFNPAIAPKTLWRLRNNPPETITSQQLLLLARLLTATTGIDASNLFHHIRHPLVPACQRLKLIAAGEVFGHSLKTRAVVKNMCDDLANTARHIRLLDRDNSFSYLLPPDDETSTQNLNHQPMDRACAAPQVSITITLSSLIKRKQVFGDEAIECLIDHVERDAHLTIVDDSRRKAGRTRRGIFSDAKAMAIIDERAMFVLPDHGRAVRCYRANQSSVHSEIIQSGINQLGRIGQFGMKLTDRSALISFLKSHLSYCLPYAGEKLRSNFSSSANRAI